MFATNMPVASIEYTERTDLFVTSQLYFDSH